MKVKMISLLLMLFIGTYLVPQKIDAQSSVSFQVFYDDLSPYGTWVDNPQYGYVWVPNVSPIFSPYATNGYWIYTDAGWTWYSNYPWGWAPFHYGRWYNDITYGPVWVPGYEWGPGWVSWRSSASYYGWAPMGPGVTMGMAYGSGYYDTYNSYTFVRCGNMGRTNINNYYVTNNTTIVNNTTVINNNHTDKLRNVTYSAGPQRTEVEKRAGKTFAPVAIRESNKPGQRISNNQLQLYRPDIKQNGSAGVKPVPGKVVDLKEVKTSAQRKSEMPVQKPNQPILQKTSPAKRTVQPNQPQRIKQPNEHKQKPSQENSAPVTKPQNNVRPTPQPQQKREPSHQGANQPRPVNPPQQMEERKEPQRNAVPTQQEHIQPQQNRQQMQPSEPRQNNPPHNTGGENTDQPPQQRENIPNNNENGRPH